MSQRFHVWTVGCQMNVADSERIASELTKVGYEESLDPSEADLIVLNTCAIRQSAEDRAVGRLGELQRLKRLNPALKIALTGCLVGKDTTELRRRFPHVDGFFRPQAFVELVEEMTGKGCVDEDRYVFPTLQGALPGPSVFIPIIKGCNKVCTYCIVPYRRGKEVSRPIAEVAEEVQSLATRGAKEVTLLGQNVDSYGHDLPGHQDLADLLAELNPIDGLERIRFLTSHPNDMATRIIDAVASLNKVCEHINLPVQAGNDRILLAMRRGYTIDRYRALVDQIRSTIPGVSLSTDIIVGFPSESDADFEDTFRLLEDIRFEVVHVAAYSPRPGTAAHKRLPDDVPLQEKKLRLARIEQLQETIGAEVNLPMVGKTVQVLFENQVRGRWQGRTRANRLVFVEDARDLTGQLAGVAITGAGPWSMQGVLRSDFGIKPKQPNFEIEFPISNRELTPLGA